MFERFTDPAREALREAQQEAMELRHGYLGTEHLLLGLLRQGHGAAARALGQLGVDLETVRDDVIREIGRGPIPGPSERDAEALRAIGIDVDEVRRRVEETFGPGALDLANQGRKRRRRRCDPPPARFGGRLPFTPRAKKVLELSLREAIRFGHSSIGTEHLLLAIVREGRGVAAEILVARGAGCPAVEGAVREQIERGGDPPAAAS
jgi:ATP-dependent Clp protease ATP-binding subunit ClpA